MFKFGLNLNQQSNIHPEIIIIGGEYHVLKKQKELLHYSLKYINDLILSCSVDKLKKCLKNL